jgi:hypothetical protein
MRLERQSATLCLICSTAWAILNVSLGSPVGVRCFTPILTEANFLHPRDSTDSSDAAIMLA